MLPCALCCRHPRLLPRSEESLKGIDPNLARADVHTMGDLMSEASARRRFQTSLLTVFAAIALPAGAGRPLRSDGLFRELPDPRIRHPHGPRRTTNASDAVGPKEGSVPVGIGPGLGAYMLVDRNARDQSVPFRRWRTRPSHNCFGVRVACGLRPRRCADPGATRGLDRSHAGAADGVGERQPRSIGRLRLP